MLKNVLPMTSWTESGWWCRIAPLREEPKMDLGTGSCWVCVVIYIRKKLVRKRYHNVGTVPILRPWYYCLMTPTSFWLVLHTNSSPFIVTWIMDMHLQNQPIVNKDLKTKLFLSWKRLHLSMADCDKVGQVWCSRASCGHMGSSPH